MQPTNVPVLYFLQTLRTGLVVNTLSLLFCLIFVHMAQMHCSYGFGQKVGLLWARKRTCFFKWLA